MVEDMTEGMLLREIMTKPDFAGYAAMIIDESHATMNAAKFLEYFDDAPIFNIPGRMYPVDILYTPNPEANYLHAAVTTVFQIHTKQRKGDILVS
ncbi:hypothetical protein O181_061062 [Austropuccinia psidii MF-1]|uniref:Uncharacterized protein n=1 Tax=Austropuccinia psidii MF-1 TaxID=1389203 RepID=A0A9Q3EJW7_9BASI|nr:hypothetical protein [Austropuccinia psidii MF-1]